jgi:hypothetical protein
LAVINKKSGVFLPPPLHFFLVPYTTGSSCLAKTPIRAMTPAIIDDIAVRVDVTSGPASADCVGVIIPKPTSVFPVLGFV